MNDYDLINMHDDINTLNLAVGELTAAVNQIKNTEVVDLWNHVNKNKQDLDVVVAQARFNAEEIQRLRKDLETVDNNALFHKAEAARAKREQEVVIDSNSITMDDLRNDINGVNQDLQALTSTVEDLDHRVRFS